ncbi:hypothetical protein D3C86_1491110 [compost metagenome]
MHHAALDRPGPHDGHLHHEVVVLARLQARQHRLLRARLDLEHAHGIRLADHLVGLVVGLGQVFHAARQPGPLGLGVRDHRQRAPDGREHAEGEHIHLEQPQRFKVVLVPLDHAAVGHGRVLDWHQPGKLATREHKTSCVLGEMPREAKQRHGHVCPALGQCRFRIHAAFAKTLKEIRFAVEPMVRFRDQVDDRGIHT